MAKVARDFISEEKRKYKWVLGKILASSLSGFIAGIIVTALFFYALFDISLK